MKFQDLHQFERKCVTVISVSLAYQHKPIIAYSEKQNINRLPDLESEQNLYKEALIFTNLRANLYQ